MLTQSLAQIQAWLQQQGVDALLHNCSAQQAANIQVQRIHTDSRSLEGGDLFVALKGERFDAHSFLAQLNSTGVVAALVEQPSSATDLPQLQVKSTKTALGAIATAWRQLQQLPIIAVTGSNGKTTVTQMIAAILQQAFADDFLATKGNFNNDVGVPLTLLRLQPQHKAAVIELGMNHLGEIANLAAMVGPTVALVNNAQREHQEFVPGIAAAAQENASVFASLPADGVAIYPGDDQYGAIWKQAAQQRPSLSFAVTSTQPPADISAQAKWCLDHWQVRASTPQGELQYSLAMVGLHNVHNSLAAVTAALAIGIDAAVITQALAQFKAVAGRSQLQQFTYQGEIIQLIDDSYNANPDSVLAAIKALTQLPQPQLLVLGDMGEIGADGLAFYQEIAACANKYKVDLWTLGTASAAAAEQAGGQHFSSKQQLQQQLLAQLPHYRSIAVKGSRFMKMEQLIQDVMQVITAQQTVGEAIC